MVNVFCNTNTYIINNKQFTGEELNKFMNEIQKNNYIYESEERELFETCWFMME